jgi:hypothetical protein
MRRGVSYSEYQVFARRVRRGEVTWKQLERAGEVLPDQRYSDAHRRVDAILARTRKAGRK